MSFSPHVSDRYDLPFETLAEKYPKVAVEAISKTHRLYYDWKPVQGMMQITFKLFLSASMINNTKKSFHLMKDKDHSFAEKPSMRPRFLEEVMRSPTNLDFFKRYLRAYDAHGALNFYHEVDKLRHVDSLLQKTKINSIVSRFLRRLYSFITLRFSGYMPSMGSRQIEPVDLCSEQVDSSHLKKRVINQKLITVEFLVNDLSFYLETESFRNMADSGTMMASAGMYGENDNALLHQKAEMIIKLFLKSEISPKLRVNITESARDSIQQAFAMGKVDRGLFHEAIMAVFPNLIFLCSGVWGFVWYNLFFKVQRDVPLSLSTDDYTTLRFTVHDGLNLVLPQTRLECKKLP
uniref:RGS domain-containing protein n=1 Tax=Salmo trutta TaxID=8032 RepID=A0A674BPX6_SALTR